MHKPIIESDDYDIYPEKLSGGDWALEIDVYFSGYSGEMYCNEISISYEKLKEFCEYIEKQKTKGELR